METIKKIWRILAYWATDRPKLVLFGMIFLNIFFWSGVCFWKYRMYLYNGFDLAYFSQIFWNMLDGRFFTQSLHPHLSLGDHAELIMPALLPLYSLWPDPRMLMLLQQAVLAVSAWPLYLLAKGRFLASGASGNWLKAGPLLVAVIWLMNPSVHHIGLFEFHILPFALPLLFMALLSYDRGQIKPFLIWSFLAMLVREDVAMVVFMVGLLAWIEGKKPIWRWLPPLIAAVWFILMMALISSFSPDGGYKFMIYYSWLGATPLEAFMNIFRHPMVVLGHVMTLANFEMVLGLVMSVAFLPILAPVALVLAILPATQMILHSAGGGELVLRTHYAVLFLPAVFLATIAALIKLPQALRRLSWVPERHLYIWAGSVVFAVVAYSCLTLGPLLPSVRMMISPGQIAERAIAADKMLANVPEDASVVASFGLLPKLSSRKELYSLNYQFLGVTQYGISDYRIPDDVRFMAVDLQDFTSYAAQFAGGSWASNYYFGGFSRLRSVAGRLSFSSGDFRLYDRLIGPYVPQPLKSQGFYRGKSNILEMSYGSSAIVLDPEDGSPILEVMAGWRTEEHVGEEWMVKVKLVDHSGYSVWEREYPFGSGLLSSTELMADRFLGTKIRTPIIGVLPGLYSVRVEIFSQLAVAHLDGVDSIRMYPSIRHPIGEFSFGEVSVF